MWPLMICIQNIYGIVWTEPNNFLRGHQNVLRDTKMFPGQHKDMWADIKIFRAGI